MQISYNRWTIKINTDKISINSLYKNSLNKKLIGNMITTVLNGMMQTRDSTGQKSSKMINSMTSSTIKATLLVKMLLFKIILNQIIKTKLTKTTLHRLIAT